MNTQGAAVACAVLFGAASLGCAADPIVTLKDGKAWWADQLADARRRGAEDGARAVANGRPRVLLFGLPTPGGAQIDPETGLPHRACGCSRTEDSGAYVDAFNAVIFEALERGDLDEISLKHKLTDHETVRARFEFEGGDVLAQLGDQVQSPDSGILIQLDTPEWSIYHAISGFRSLFAKPEGDAARAELRSALTPPVHVLFDHVGTTLLVATGDQRAPLAPGFLVYDLPSGTLIQRLFAPLPKAVRGE